MTTALLDACGQPLNAADHADELALDALLGMLADPESNELPSNEVLDVELPRAFASKQVAGAHYAHRKALNRERVSLALEAKLLVPRFYELAARQLDFAEPAFWHYVDPEVWIDRAVVVNSAPLLRAILATLSWRQSFSPYGLCEFHYRVLANAANAIEAYRQSCDVLTVVDELMNKFNHYTSTLIHIAEWLSGHPLVVAALCQNVTVVRWMLARAQFCEQLVAEFKYTMFNQSWLKNIYWKLVEQKKPQSIECFLSFPHVVSALAKSCDFVRNDGPNIVELCLRFDDSPALVRACWPSEPVLDNEDLGECLEHALSSSSLFDFIVERYDERLTERLLVQAFRAAGSVSRALTPTLLAFFGRRVPAHATDDAFLRALISSHNEALAAALVARLRWPVADPDQFARSLLCRVDIDDAAAVLALRPRKRTKRM